MDPAQAAAEQQTTEVCWLCNSTHPVTEGIHSITRRFEHCGVEWEDTWCCDCDDECPECGMDVSSVEVLEEETIVEPVEVTA